MESLPNTLALVAALLLEFLGVPAPTRTDNTHALTVKPAAEENHRKVASAVANDPDFWSAPFVLADRQRREVIVWGQVTGMLPGDPLEFFVVGEGSGHEYESFMTAFAKPSDIHKALEFIGLTPGGAVDPGVQRFWPRGSRVVPTVSLKLPGEDAPKQDMAIEHFITRPNGTVMEPQPWVFTGAPMLPAIGDPGRKVYAADEYSPNSIASTFNLANTVFDLPVQGSKTQVYGQFARNRALPVPEASPVLLHLRPAPAGSVPADTDIRLVYTAAGLTVHIGGETHRPSDLNAFLAARENENHFLTIDFAPDLPLDRLIAIAREIQMLERNSPRVRVEPPPPGQFYYMAYVPDPRFRKREDRPSQPLELHLSPAPGGGSQAILYELEEVWGEGRTPTVLETRTALANPAAWRAWLEQKNPRIPVLFLYATGETRHADLLAWTEGLTTRFPVIFVFQEE